MPRPLNEVIAGAPAGSPAGAAVSSRHAGARARWISVFLAAAAVEAVVVLAALGATIAAAAVALIALAATALMLLTAPPASAAVGSVERPASSPTGMDTEEVPPVHLRMRTTTAVGGPRDRSARARVASLWSMLQAMSPAILLGACYPIVGPQLGSHDVGGIPLSSLVVGVSVAVPWLSQVAGTPVYRLIGDAPYRGDGAARRFVRVWPALFALVLPPVLVVTALVALTTGWSATAMGAYIALALMNMLFVQSLVVADMGGSRGRWTLGWVAYAIALLIAPTIWILPPLAGLVSQVLLMGRALGGLAHPAGVSLRPFIADTARGLVMGGVLWSDKLLLFLVNGTDFDVATVYLCLQPAVVAYSYYFAITSPSINRAVARFHAQLADASMDRLRDQGRFLRGTVSASLRRTAVVGVVSVGLAVLVAALLGGGGTVGRGLNVSDVIEVALIAGASLMLTALTLLAYEIEHVGDRTAAIVLSGAHMVAALALFIGLGTTAVRAYGAVGIVDLVLVAVAIAVYRSRWSSPEYAFFWGKALSW